VLHTVESNEDEPHGLRRGAGLTRGDLFPVVLALALFGLICAGLLIAFGVPRDPAAAGQFGDAFGSLSALFNGLAFAALYIALMLQGKQLFLQRRELSLQREELALTRGELKAQATTMRRQQFEGTFFGALQVLARIESALHNPGNVDPSLQGIRAFDYFGQALRARDNQLLTQSSVNENPLAARETYMAWHRDLGRHVDRYLDTLQEVLRLIERSELPDRQTYANLVRAAMTPEQMFLVFHHGALFRRDRPDGDQQFRQLLELFGFFRDFDMQRFLAPGASRSLWYRAGATGPGIMVDGKAV
jgi:hypothetical protein